MGNYLLCNRPLAKTPFYIESIHLNIYSLEELCYFLSTNLALAREVILDPELSRWLFEECGMNNIREYNTIAVTGGRTGYRLYWIFAKSFYFTENELRRLKMKIDSFDALSPLERQKKKGDALLKFGKYKRSIDCYEEVFTLEGIENAAAFFKASVYNNMGCAYGKLFQSARAAECFKKAYNTDGSVEFRDAYLKALYFDGGYEKMNAEMDAIGIDYRLKQSIRQEIAQIKAGPIEEDMDKELDKWIKNYHLSVDQ